MWLLDTAAKHLHNFQDDQIPSYAILSHRWEKQEVTFRMLEEVDMVAESADETEEDRQAKATELEEFPHLVDLLAFRRRRLFSRQGWMKIANFCKTAQKDGYQYAWIDTCCIDKSSSAELQEAINSMYKWYQNSVMCYVYMSDVKFDASEEEREEPWKIRECLSQFRNSKWFTRGWTLQELLAPQELKFLDGEWRSLGTEEAWLSHIRDVTLIPTHAIKGSQKQEAIKWSDVAAKMSWMAKRTTTRREDMAYCLLGIFGVNMPLLYGEGLENAFLRLQLEIMKVSRDETIFLWKHTYLKVEGSKIDMLARNPHDFQTYNPAVIYRVDNFLSRGPTEMTNQGFRIAMLLFKYSELEAVLQWQSKPNHTLPLKNVYFAPLTCQSTSHMKTIFIPLMRQVTSHAHSNLFQRLPGLAYAAMDWLKALKKRDLETIYVVPDLDKHFVPRFPVMDGRYLEAMQVIY